MGLSGGGGVNVLMEINPTDIKKLNNALIEDVSK